MGKFLSVGDHCSYCQGIVPRLAINVMTDVQKEWESESHFCPCVHIEVVAELAGQGCTESGGGTVPLLDDDGATRAQSRGKVCSSYFVSTLKMHWVPLNRLCAFDCRHGEVYGLFYVHNIKIYLHFNIR